MKRIIAIIGLLLLCKCQNFGQLKMRADLPKDLKEVSGNEVINGANNIWMLNDGGNKSELFEISEQGKIIHVLDIKAKNHDWEDLTSDDDGNLYIGDFGNNRNKRKNLRILKVSKANLTKKETEVEEIMFRYPNQKKFPPKKKKRFFDAEAFFYFNENLYIFTKSRVNKEFGKTSLYKVPAKKGNYVAELIGKFENCNDLECWITSADISPKKDKIVLLSQKKILVISNFNGDNFVYGDVRKIELTHRSQKEGICFKNNNTLLITDERAGGLGRNLYELSIK